MQAIVVPPVFLLAQCYYDYPAVLPIGLRVAGLDQVSEAWAQSC